MLPLAIVEATSGSRVCCPVRKIRGTPRQRVGGNEQDHRLGCCAPQSCTSRIYMHFLFTFQEGMLISNPRNQLSHRLERRRKVSIAFPFRLTLHLYSLSVWERFPLPRHTGRLQALLHRLPGLRRRRTCSLTPVHTPADGHERAELHAKAGEDAQGEGQHKNTILQQRLYSMRLEASGPTDILAGASEPQKRRYTKHKRAHRKLEAVVGMVLVDEAGSNNPSVKCRRRP